jgi:hypothetical protein
VDFALTQVAVSLASVVATATSETRRVEIGNAVSVSTQQDQNVPVQNVNDLLSSRAAGVTVTGDADRRRGAYPDRSTNSLSLNNSRSYHRWYPRRATSARRTCSRAGRSQSYR